MPRARTKHASWSLTAGEKGVNRVRVFVHRTGTLYLEYLRDGRKIRQSLGHTDRERARQEAYDLAAALLRPDAKTPVLLGQLFDNYLKEVTPTKGQSGQYHDRRVLELMRKLFGADRRLDSLTHRDAAQFISERKRLGDLRPRAKPKEGQPQRVRHHPIGSRIIASDLKLLKAVLNWGMGAGWLDRNPLQSYKVVEEGTPHRPVFTGPQYQALLAVAPQFPWQFRSLLILAHETGHRISAMLHLRWSDIDLAKGMFTWRQEADKIGYQHETPITPEARAMLEEARQHSPGIGDTPLIPSPRDRSVPVSRDLARDWMQRAQVAAELPPEPGRGWHAFRRNFASELRDAGLRDLCDLGGWKEPMTVVKCYQRPSDDAMRKAQAKRRVLEA
jgi:integrase